MSAMASMVSHAVPTVDEGARWNQTRVQTNMRTSCRARGDSLATTRSLSWSDV